MNDNVNDDDLITIEPKVSFEGTSYDTNDDGDLLNTDGTVFKTKAELTDTSTDEPTTIEIDGVEYTINEAGDAIDKDNKVIKTKEELTTLADDAMFDVEEVEIDGTTYTINKDGDAIDANGTVFKNKAELDALVESNDGDVNTIQIDKISASTGLTILDANNEAVVYDNSEAGVAAYVKDVHSDGVTNGINAGIKSIYDINPLIQSFVEHVKLNGSADGFNQDVAYSIMKVDDKNEDAMISIIRSARKAKGDTEAEISQQVSWAKNANQLKEYATSSLTYLQEQESVDSKNRSTELQQKEISDKAILDSEINAVNNILNTGKIKLTDTSEFVIPKTLTVPTSDGKSIKVDSNNLTDFITTIKEYNVDGKVVKMTPFEAKKLVAERNQTTEQKLIHAIQLLTGSKMEDVLAKSVSSATVKKIRKFTTKRNKSGGSNTNNDTTFNKKNIIFE